MLGAQGFETPLESMPSMLGCAEELPAAPPEMTATSVTGRLVVGSVASLTALTTGMISPGSMSGAGAGAGATVCATAALPALCGTLLHAAAGSARCNAMSAVEASHLKPPERQTAVEHNEQQNLLHPAQKNTVKP